MKDTQSGSSACSQADALYTQALAHFDQGQYSACLTLLHQALSLDRSNADIYYARGNTRYELHDYRGAAAEYLWALRRDPSFANALMNLGNAYCALEQYEKALMLYDRALILLPEDGIADYNKANVLVEVGDLWQALEAYTQALELGPSAWAYVNRGHVASRLGLEAIAWHDYDQAFRIAPDDPNTAWTYLWVHMASAEYNEKTINELLRIAQIDPEDSLSPLCMGVAALLQNDLAQARSTFEQAARHYPQHCDPPFWKGIAAAMQGEVEIGQQAIEQAIAMGLPPILMHPLTWLEPVQPEFFERFARPLFSHFGGLQKSASVQAAMRLLAAALRDPADIVEFSTIWRCMRIVEAFCTHLSETERESPLYQKLVNRVNHIAQMQHDLTLAPEGDGLLRLGAQLTEAFAAYVEQAAHILVFLLEHRPASQLTSPWQEFEQLVRTVVQEVERASHLEAVDRALTIVKASQEQHREKRIE